MEATVKTRCILDGIEFKCCICKFPNGRIEDGSNLCDFLVILGTEVQEW